MNPAGPEAATARRRRLRAMARTFAGNRAALVGLALLVVILGTTLLGPVVHPVDPFDIVGAPHTPPGDPEAWLGTDHLGRDVLAGLLRGGRPTLAVGAFAALIMLAIGVTIGALAGYFGGWVDEVLTRFTELFQVLPALLFAMVVVTLFSPSLLTTTLAIGVVSWTQVARLTRGEFLRIRSLEYVQAARAMGAGTAHLMWRVILPNAMPPLVVAATLAVGVAILFEAGLSFLGLSDPNVMSWGLMIGSNRNNMLEAWWGVTFPGAAVFLSVLAISLVGDGLNDALNPRLRR